MITFHFQEVAPDEQHRVAKLTVAGWQHQLVLAEHPSREKSKYRTHLGAHDPSGQAAAETGDRTQSLFCRCEQGCEGLHVRRRPLIAADHKDLGNARPLEPGLVGHELGGARHQSGCVASQLGFVVGPLERISPANALGNRNGE